MELDCHEDCTAYGFGETGRKRGNKFAEALNEKQFVIDSAGKMCRKKETELNCTQKVGNPFIYSEEHCYTGMLSF